MTRRPGLGYWLTRLSLFVMLSVALPARAAQAPDPDALRLTAILAALDQDPGLADKAALERFKARQAIAALQAARSRDHVHTLYLAQTWVEAAQEAAQADVLLQQSVQLDRERDQIMLDASRRDAELARRDAERLRLQTEAREEETGRQAELERLATEQATASAEVANAQATQAMKLADARGRETELARKEAQLAAAVAADSLADVSGSAAPPPSRHVAGRTVYSLPGSAFASGSARLTASAQASLRALAAALAGRRAVRVEAHTDSQGSDAANLALSQKRADAVRRALFDAGLIGAHIDAVGVGKAAPVADNGSAEGRLRNRRIEISVQ